MHRTRRLVAGLGAVYMLALVLMPCSDDCASDPCHSYAAVQSAQEHHEEEHDQCSPFCICSCCAASVSITHHESALFNPAYTAEIFTTYGESENSTFTADFWQPPRLS